VALPECTRCGNTDPRRMVGLMTLWFGPFVGLRSTTGYFYLCPPCYEEHIAPHLDEAQGRLADLYRLARQMGLHDEILGDESDEASPTGAMIPHVPAPVAAGGDGIGR
jgi:hypothetical protein